VARSLKTAFLICPVVILGIVAGLRTGPAGVAMGYSIAMALLFVPVVLWALHGTGITMRAYFDAVKHPIAAGLCGGLVGWIGQGVLRSRLAPIPLLAAELTASSLVYALVLLFVMGQKNFYFDLVHQIRNRGEQSPAIV